MFSWPIYSGKKADKKIQALMDAMDAKKIGQNNKNYKKNWADPQNHEIAGNSRN